MKEPTSSCDKWQDAAPLQARRAVTTYIDREMDRRVPGDQVPLTVLRDGSGRTCRHPGRRTKLAREVPRRYFERLGLTCANSCIPMRSCAGQVAEQVGDRALCETQRPHCTAGLQTDIGSRRSTGRR